MTPTTFQARHLKALTHTFQNCRLRTSETFSKKSSRQNSLPLTFCPARQYHGLGLKNNTGHTTMFPIQQPFCSNAADILKESFFHGWDGATILLPGRRGGGGAPSWELPSLQSVRAGRRGARWAQLIGWLRETSSYRRATWSPCRAVRAGRGVLLGLWCAVHAAV